MEPLDLDALDADSAAFDAAVAATPGIDAFCSSSDWILPAARALMAPRAPYIRRGRHGYVALMRAVQAGSSLPVLEPLEAMWGLGCPIVGEDADALADELAADLDEDLARTGVRVPLLLCGLGPQAPIASALVRRLARRYELRLAPPTRRYVADLSSGVDGFLGHRSPNLRRSIERALRRAHAERVEFVSVAVAPDGAPAAYERLLAVERRSWKGLQDVGIASGAMNDFYRHMLPRLARQGALRLLFATRDGVDLAFIVGAVRARRYRGLQFSYDAAHTALSLGNLCQLHQVRALVDEGVLAYDLGADVEYKARWGEIAMDTASLVAIPRG